VRLDLGGIGKGFALDSLAAVLKEWDIESALLRASDSTMLALSPPPGEPGWPVSFGPSHDCRRLKLADAAFSGSGKAVKGDHIINPHTGHPAEGNERAWAGAPSAAVADALSTAFMVMSEEAVRDFCKRNPGISAFVQRSSSASVLEIR
jgi:thiamine biosynthesis lipoprotein